MSLSMAGKLLTIVVASPFMAAMVAVTPAANGYKCDVYGCNGDDHGYNGGSGDCDDGFDGDCCRNSSGHQSHGHGMSFNMMP